MIGTNAYLFYQYKKTETFLIDKGDKLEAKLEDTEAAKNELDSMLRVSQMQLEDYKGENDSLNEVIDMRNKELSQRAAEINELLHNKNISKKELERAIEQLDKFKYYAQKYQKEIEKLTQEVTELKSENSKIKSEKRELEKKSEGFELKNIEYQNKINLAKKLSAINVVGQGVKIKSNGNESVTIKASKTEQLKVTFTFTDNPLADKGSKDVYVKIIDPNGSTLFVEETGSGKFMQDGQQSMFTVKKSVNFDNSGDPVVIYWKKGNDYTKGHYTIEVFCEGFQIGAGAFDLK
ncbi:MAG: hypothetical protein HYZ42_10040 [Bacteroidetes bacterium]|nr:hypothetical protein [Bacteroidota bacterium]